MDVTSHVTHPFMKRVSPHKVLNYEILFEPDHHLQIS